ncbi:MAG: hypothetical protein PHQ04_00365 [Opitutaceae bacterium]|nr:hypothetical protein [Opitutaceae bacterium]
MTDPAVDPALRRLSIFTAPLVAAAEASARVARQYTKESRRKRRGATPRPGSDTPLWNELAQAVARHLTKRGDKVKLARVLGVSRQRLHLLVVARSAYPDAERALLLLAWLQARERGRDLA